MKIHIMGIGGSGVSGVAYLASKMGYEVSGCDLEENTAYAKHIYKGHNPKHLEGIDFLVVSPAIYYQNKNNPELLEGERRRIVMTWEEFLGKYLSKDKKLFVLLERMENLLLPRWQVNFFMMPIWIHRLWLVQKFRNGMEMLDLETDPT